MIDDAVSMMNKGGRICIITFHSLEDRIVQNQFGNISVYDHDPIFFRQADFAYDEEVERNPRARSAKLRVAEKK